MRRPILLVWVKMFVLRIEVDRVKLALREIQVTQSRSSIVTDSDLDKATQSYRPFKYVSAGSTSANKVSLYTEQVAGSRQGDHTNRSEEPV